MRNKILFILTILGSHSYSQELDSLTQVTIHSTVFSEFISDSRFINDSIFYFKTNKASPTSNIVTNNLHMNFISEEEIYRLIKKKKIEELYEIRIDNKAIDTIDVNITGWSVEFKRNLFKNNEFRFGIWCGGTAGDIPDGRFVYDNQSKFWTFHSLNDLIDQNWNKNDLPTRVIKNKQGTE